MRTSLPTKSSQENQLIKDMILMLEGVLVGASMGKFKDKSGQRIINLEEEVVWSGFDTGKLKSGGVLRLILVKFALLPRGAGNENRCQA